MEPALSNHFMIMLPLKYLPLEFFAESTERALR
jgi:hypothetical protein